jgi:hypothetical protein
MKKSLHKIKKRSTIKEGIKTLEGKAFVLQTGISKPGLPVVFDNSNIPRLATKFKAQS